MEEDWKIELIVKLIDIGDPLDSSDSSHKHDSQGEISSVIMISEYALLLGSNV